MATFSSDGSDLGRIDWMLLQSGPVALYCRPATLDADLGSLRALGYRVVDVDGAAWGDAPAMHRDLAAALGFPAHYGKNLDAMNDCVSELDLPDAGGLVLVLRRFDAFAARNEEVAHGVLDLLADNARRFLLFGRRLLVLVQSDDADIGFAPVGATPVAWNPRERADGDRRSP